MTCKSAFALCVILTCVDAGCWEERFCCPGRNNTCSVILTGYKQRHKRELFGYAREGENTVLEHHFSINPSFREDSKRRASDQRNVFPLTPLFETEYIYEDYEYYDSSSENDTFVDSVERLQHFKKTSEEEEEEDSGLVKVKTKNEKSLENYAPERCYCDHTCRALGDCCHDIDYICAATDCQVSWWSPWEPCASPNPGPGEDHCGLGRQVRHRQVVRKPMNGGEPCPDLEQTRGCYGSNPACHRAYQEHALILPYHWTESRLPTDLRIPKNLDEVYYEKPMDVRQMMPKGVTNCTMFKLRWMSDECRDGVHELSGIGQNAMMCAECQPEARHTGHRCVGEGLRDRASMWMMADNHKCFGLWTPDKTITDCKCVQDFRHITGFIFV